MGLFVEVGELGGEVFPNGNAVCVSVSQVPVMTTSSYQFYRLLSEYCDN